jgi:hypothetical protein
MHLGAGMDERHGLFGRDRPAPREEDALACQRHQVDRIPAHVAFSPSFF